MLDAAQRSRHARHLLLVEIGEAGQERLSGASFVVAAGADPRAAAVAADYLTRCGMQHASAGAADVLEVAPVDTDTVRGLAGEAHLHEAAAALLGAFAAVESIKRCLGVGAPGVPPTALRDTTGHRP